jgi:hypothetical protein
VGEIGHACAGTTTYQFFVRQASPSSGATVPLTVTDTCGDWPTLVGGGPHAFGTTSAPPAAATPRPAATR